MKKGYSHNQIKTKIYKTKTIRIKIFSIKIKFKVVKLLKVSNSCKISNNKNSNKLIETKYNNKIN
jgi:hypothetical protein